MTGGEFRAICERLAAAAEAALPPWYHGKVQISVDSGKVSPQNVVLEMRIKQPKAGMGPV